MRSPLQELPLDRFLLPNPNMPRSSKRPLSPGGPSLFSPAKRRILNEEGIFSPEKTTKSPVSARGRASTPARFTDVLSGPGSPARKLDFGAPIHRPESTTVPHMASIVAEATPSRPTSSSIKLAPSPEFKSNRSFSCQPDNDQEMEGHLSSRAHSSSYIFAAVTPREIPPPLDPRSIHYPGFRVHHDTYMTSTPLDDDLQTLALGAGDKDGQKENLPPHRKPRNVATISTTYLKTQLFSPDAKKSQVEKTSKGRSTPATPRKVNGGDRQDPAGSPTPRRPAVGLTRVTMASTPRLMEQERKEMRKVLQDEANEVGSDDEDSDSV